MINYYCYLNSMDMFVVGFHYTQNLDLQGHSGPFVLAELCLQIGGRDQLSEP